MKFAPKHVVMIVMSICAALILAPVGVMAATGQLVNLVDPADASRKARIGSAGSLRVETRPGVTNGAQNVVHNDIASLSPRALLEATAPTRIALSELTIAVRKFGSPVNAPTIVDLVHYVRASGSNPCGQAGWMGTSLRRVTLTTDRTEQLTFAGPPLIVPTPADGKRHCLAAKLYQWVGDTRVDIGATVFTYRP